MPSVITNLCMREGACINVCPADCIVPGKPSNKYPQYYIDPESCIDCGSCISVCPHSAIYPDDMVPTAYQARGGESLYLPLPVEIVKTGDQKTEFMTLSLQKDEIVNLYPSILENARFFSEGPGYEALFDEEL